MELWATVVTWEANDLKYQSPNLGDSSTCLCNPGSTSYTCGQKHTRWLKPGTEERRGTARLHAQPWAVLQASLWSRDQQVFSWKDEVCTK